MTSMTRMRNLAAGTLVCVTAACVGEQTPSADAAITRDAFVEVYVELRMAALQSPEGRISESEREEILAGASLTEEDLLEFIDMHARRLEHMAEVWGEIDDTLRVLRTREANPASEPGA